MINGINSQSIPVEYVAQAKNNSSENSNNAVSEQKKQNGPAVIAEISEEGKKLGEMYRAGEGPTNTEESYLQNKDEVKSDAKNAREEARAAEPLFDPFNDSYNLYGVRYIYDEGSMEEYIQKGLEGKAINPSLVAEALSQKLKGSVYNPDATIEERAVDRETAMKHVEYIAQNYFTDPDEAKAFVDGVRGFAEKDIQREKGYVVFDNDQMEPSWSYGTVNGERTIPVDEFAKKYGSTVDELSETPEKWDGFMDALSKNREKWTAEIVTAFEDNEKRVADIISQSLGLLSETNVNITSLCTYNHTVTL